MDTQLIQYAKAQQTFPNSFNTQEFTSNCHKYLFLRMDDIRVVINISVTCSLPFLTIVIGMPLMDSHYRGKLWFESSFLLL